MRKLWRNTHTANLKNCSWYKEAEGCAHSKKVIVAQHIHNKSAKTVTAAIYYAQMTTFSNNNIISHTSEQ